MKTLNESKMELLDMTKKATIEQLTDTAALLTAQRDTGETLDIGRTFLLGHAINELSTRLPHLDAVEEAWFENDNGASLEATLLAAV